MKRKVYKTVPKGTGLARIDHQQASRDYSRVLKRIRQGLGTSARNGINPPPKK